MQQRVRGYLKYRSYIALCVGVAAFSPFYGQAQEFGSLPHVVQTVKPHDNTASGQSPNLFSGLFAPKTTLPTPREFTLRMEMGDVAQAKAWLENGLDPDFQGDRIGTGLMIGAWEGKISLMEAFLAKGADINMINRHGEQAILFAAWQGHLPVVKWLVERGAEINRRRNEWTALHYAAFAGHQEVVDYLIKQGADINATTTNGSSALMLSIYEGKGEIAKKLIEQGANRRIKNERGDGAMEWAMKYNQTQIARTLAETPEQFADYASQPKAAWGEVKRSEKMPADLAALLKAREQLIAKGLSPEKIDQNIALLRARYATGALTKISGSDQNGKSLEITASRRDPKKQSARLVKDKKK